MDLSVADAAAQLGVTSRRVRALIEEGRIPAHRVGGQWIVDVADLPRRARRPGRPLSARMAWALAWALEARITAQPPFEAARLASEERRRLQLRLDVLDSASEVAPLLRSWMPSRASRHPLSCASPEALVDDPRLIVSGVSDPRSGMLTNDVEGYVDLAEIDAFRRDHLVVQPSARGRRPHVFLHAHDPRQSHLARDVQIPVLVAAADLADHDGPREDAQAENLLARWTGANQP